MMRRGVPEWFKRGNARQWLHRGWPWMLSSTCAVLYFYNREPFDEAAGSLATKVRRPLLRTTEWIELHDVDPETMALELPPDVLFGPLELSKQMRFLLAALRADNEYADGYLARIIVDHMDLSLDPPLLKEQDFIAAGGGELLDFAVEDFTVTGSRTSRKHIFFSPDTFLQLINLVAPYPQLTQHFIHTQNGIELILKALRHSESPFARVLALRALTLFAFTQPEDGTVERRLMQANGVPAVVEAYRASTGDPTDTRFATLLLSSILRHYPVEGGREFLEANGIGAVVNNLNISRYKGLPQHIRLLHDAQRLPSSATGGVSVNARIEDASFVGVAIGLLDAFPEYYEAAGSILKLLLDIVPAHSTPFELLQHRAMPILSKFYVKWKDDVTFRTDGTCHDVVTLFRAMTEDRTCRRCFDPSVASYELQECLKTAEIAIAQEQQAAHANKHKPRDGLHKAVSTTSRAEQQPLATASA